MEIEEADSVGTVDYRGVKYYFCADSCLERFKANPREFLEPKAPSTLASGTMAPGTLAPGTRHRGTLAPGTWHPERRPQPSRSASV
jgi:YHS domain-containing protein